MACIRQGNRHTPDKKSTDGILELKVCLNPHVDLKSLKTDPV